MGAYDGGEFVIQGQELQLQRQGLIFDGTHTHSSNLLPTQARMHNHTHTHISTLKNTNAHMHMSTLYVANTPGYI